jgi:hypothetical protein
LLGCFIINYETEFIIKIGMMRGKGYQYRKRRRFSWQFRWRRAWGQVSRLIPGKRTKFNERR